MATSQTSGVGVVVAVLGVVAVGALLYEKNKSAGGAEPSSSSGKGTFGDPGYYVFLFNYERGHYDRRVKGIRGPFTSKVNADREAALESGTWPDPVVAYGTDPDDAEKKIGREVGGAWKPRAKARRRRAPIRRRVSN